MSGLSCCRDGLLQLTHMCCCGSAVHVHSKLWRAAWPLVTTPTPCSSLPSMPTSLAPSPSPSTRAVQSWPGPCLAPRTTCLASPPPSPRRRSAKAHLMLNFVHHRSTFAFMLRVLRQQAALCISRPSLRSLSAASCNVAPLCTRGLSFRSIATTAAYTMASQAPTTADAASATAAATAAAAKTASTAASSATRRDLWPAIEPYNTGFLKVSDVHTVHRSM